MGCCQSSSATRPGAPRAVAVEQIAVAEGAAAPVLTEATAEERALTQLKLVFDGVDADENGSVGKAELSAALERDESLGALIKEAGLNDQFYVLNQFDANEDHRVTWDEFQSRLKKAAVQEVESSGNLAAAEVPADDRACARLRQIFASLDANDNGAVSKVELEAGLREAKDEHGLVKADSLGELIEQAGLNPYWCALEALDTNQDGCVTWDEFEAHLRNIAKEEVQDTGDVPAAVTLEETTSKQTCWGCC